MQILLNPFVSPELCSKNLRQFRCGVNGLQGQEDQCTVEYDPGGEFRICLLYTSDAADEMD